MDESITELVARLQEEWREKILHDEEAAQAAQLNSPAPPGCCCRHPAVTLGIVADKGINPPCLRNDILNQPPWPANLPRR